MVRIGSRQPPKILAIVADKAAPVACGGGSGRMAANLSAATRARREKRSGRVARRRKRGEGEAGAGRCGGERSEAGRGAKARSAQFANGERAERSARRTRAVGWVTYRFASPKGGLVRRTPWELRQQRRRPVASARSAYRLATAG